jgi:hypothetical protein
MPAQPLVGALTEVQTVVGNGEAMTISQSVVSEIGFILIRQETA